ncbi:MAG TPA: hypothetical protein VM900_08495 [Sphingomonas sp.]|jgi:hypothetical protein|nr:hypothetical protein [Sphingomonas sp.]
MRLVLTQDDDIVATVRAATGESIVVVLDPQWPAITLALARAAIVPLAIERAPSTRINAVLATPAASRAAVEAAIDFLESATSTTGQLLEIN